MKRSKMSIFVIATCVAMVLGGCGLPAMKAGDSRNRTEFGAFSVNDDRRIYFDSPFPSPYSARNSPASGTKADVTTLLAEGYANIGKLEIQRVMERCLPEEKGLSCKTVQHKTDGTVEFLAEAAARGGDLVLLERANEQGTEPYSRMGKCVAWEETVRYEMQYKQVYDPRSNLRSTQMLGSKPVYGQKCARFETLEGNARTSTTSGSVWRHEPEQAAAQQLNQEFLFAAALGNEDRVKTIINKGLDLNSRNMDGDLVLGVAAVFGNLKVVEALLDAGADINATDLNGTALHRAAANGHVKVARLLIARKADVEAKMPYGRHKGATPLFDAARSGSPEMVGLLISARASVDAATENGVTPLMIAALEGNTDVIDALVEAGASLHATSKPLNELAALTGWSGGWTPLMMSVIGRKHDAQMALIAHGALVSKDDIALGVKVGLAYQDAIIDRIFALGKQLYIPKHSWGYINTNGKFVIAPRLCNAASFSEGLAPACQFANPGQDGNSCADSCGYIDKSGTFVIPARYSFSAPFSEGLGAVTLIFKTKNPETNSFGACGYIDRTGKVAVPLRFNYCGKFSEGLAVAQKTIDSKKYGYLDKEGHWAIPPKFESALSFSGGYAVVYGRSSGSLRTIDRFGNYVDVNTIRRAGTSARSTKPPAVSQGLKPKAFLSPSYPKRRPFGYADAAGVIKISGPFYNAEPFSEGLAAVSVLAPELVEKWALLWAEVNRDRNLMRAIRNGDFKTSARLVGQGANVNSTDEQGMTPLMVAVATGQLRIAKFLLDKGAKVDTKNKKGYTALMYVPGTGNIKMADLLLRSGSVLSARNDLNLTAAEIADLLNDKQVSKFLRKSMPR
jgi:ankyrin repeat protein